MGHSSGLGVGSREQPPKEKAASLRTHRTKKSIEYQKVENPLYVDQHHEQRQSANHLHSLTNHNRERLESMGDKTDDLVKHMRNLPGYLQRVEKDENVQGKALNFGVLDWGRLENWKSNEKRIPPRYNMNDSPYCNNPTLSRTPNKILRPQKGLLSSPGVRWPRGKTVKVQNSEIPPAQTLDVVQTPCCKDSSDDLWLLESKISEANEARLSDSSEEFRSINPFSDVPHSCPFPVGAVGADLEPEHRYETPLKDRSLEENTPFGKHIVGTHSSPNRRFSFSLGKMGRSLSLKETSADPQPVNSDASPDLNSCNSKKESARSRSSPLRRLLDPLLKHKGAHTAPINADESVNVKNHRSSSVQALLQLTTKNGIPFFKLVVDGSSDVLAAAVKKLPTFDSSLVYAFYSVHEIKKKSWMNHGSKGKSCGFGYNVVGQMTISSRYQAVFVGSEKNVYVIKESVLYSTDAVRADEKTPECMPGRELAAVVVKNRSDGNCGDVSTLVILPGGVHTVPNCGLASPLIDRWRCGGTCDCGGWDIGCQFCILTNRNEKGRVPSPNRLDLCYQGGRVSMVSLEEGLYSVDFDAPISLLQAFSICVAVVSSQKLSRIFQANCVSMPTTGAGYVSKPPASPVGRV